MTAEAVAGRPVSLWKRFRRGLRVRALLLALPLLARLPHRLAVALGGFVGTLAYHVVSKERRLALEHLALAFPEQTPAWRRQIARDCFANLGCCALEQAAVRSFDARLKEVTLLPDADAEVLRQAHAAGKGVVFVSCHVGNWELRARRLVREGYGAATVAREANDPRLTALLEQRRAEAGLQTIWRGSPSAARELLRTLRRGDLLGLLIDQDTNVQGHFVPFFGRPAFTPRAAADLALRTGAAVVFGVAHRIAPTRHRLSLRSISIAPTGDAQQDSLALTTALTREIEAEIRASPGEWVWMHRRWRTRPPA